MCYHLPGLIAVGLAFLSVRTDEICLPIRPRIIDKMFKDVAHL